MLHMILVILKIALLLLAILLALLLLTLAGLLFVPVRYQLTAEKGEKTSLAARATWFLHLLSVRVEFGGDGLQFALRIFGHTVVGGKEKESAQRAQPPQEEEQMTPQPEDLGKTLASAPTSQKEEQTTPQPDGPGKPSASVPASKEGQETSQAISPEKGSASAPASQEGNKASPQKAEPGEISTSALASQKEGQATPQPEGPEKTSASASRTDGGHDKELRKAKDLRPPGKKKAPLSLLQKLKNLFAKIKNSFCRLLEKIQNIRQSAERLQKRVDSYLQFWRDEHTRNSVAHLKKEVFYLFKHYLPHRTEGSIRFGFEDPALTGQVLGALCAAQAFAGGNLVVEADFQHPVLEGRLYMKGRVRACHFVKALLALILDRHCRISLKRIRTWKHQ